MINEETLSKDRRGISRRMNELGLKLKDVEFFDWNPMFVIMIYEVPDEAKTAVADKAAALEQENAKLRERRDKG